MSIVFQLPQQLANPYPFRTFSLISILSSLFCSYTIPREFLSTGDFNLHRDSWHVSSCPTLQNLRTISWHYSFLQPLFYVRSILLLNAYHTSIIHAIYIQLIARSFSLYLCIVLYFVFVFFLFYTHWTQMTSIERLSVITKVKVKVNFEIYIADRKATTCI